MTPESMTKTTTTTTSSVDLVELAVAIGAIQEGQKNVVDGFKEFKTEVRHDLSEIKSDNRELRKELNELDNRTTKLETDFAQVKQAQDDQKTPKLHPVVLWATIVSGLASTIAVGSVIFFSTTG